MYFVSYNPLKEKLRNRSFSDREALPYLILLFVLQMITLSIPSASEGNMWTIVEAIFNIVVTILGVYYVYQKMVAVPVMTLFINMLYLAG